MMTAVRKVAKKRLPAVNCRGYRIGEGHHRSILTDHEVGLVFDLREEGLSLRRIAKAMEVSWSCIAKILDGRTRGQYASEFIGRVHVANRAPENGNLEEQCEAEA